MVKQYGSYIPDRSFREDVITLQNPHGMPQVSVAAASSKATEKTKQVAPRPAGGIVAVKEKAATPWNVSPYSNGMPGASLTSTSVDPGTSGTSKLLWDEVRTAS